jgi:hypothetical protein
LSKPKLFTVKSPTHSNLLTKGLLKKLLTQTPRLIEIPVGAPVGVGENHTRFTNHFDSPGPPLHVGSVHAPTRQVTHFFTNHPGAENRHRQSSFSTFGHTRIKPINFDMVPEIEDYTDGYSKSYPFESGELSGIEPSLVADDCHAWHLIGPGVFFIYTLETINTADTQKHFTHPLYACPVMSPRIEFIPMFFQPRLIMPQTRKPARIVLYVPNGVKVELYSIYPIAHLSIFTSLLTPPIEEMLSYNLEDSGQEKVSDPPEKIL